MKNSKRNDKQQNVAPAARGNSIQLSANSPQHRRRAILPVVVDSPEPVTPPHPPPAVDFK